MLRTETVRHRIQIHCANSYSLGNEVRIQGISRRAEITSRQFIHCLAGICGLYRYTRVTDRTSHWIKWFKWWQVSFVCGMSSKFQLGYIQWHCPSSSLHFEPNLVMIRWEMAEEHLTRRVVWLCFDEENDAGSPARTLARMDASNQIFFFFSSMCHYICKLQ